MENKPSVRLKSEEARMVDTIRKNSDRLSEIKNQIEKLKHESDQIEGWFLQLADSDLHNTKLQTVRYSGSFGNKVQATMTKSLKILYPSLLPRIFGSAYADAVTVENIPKYKLSKPAERLLTGLYLQNYTQSTIAEVLHQAANDDEKVYKALTKKVKGVNFAGDTKYLMAIGGLSEQSAEEYAYFVAEAAVWENFQRLLEAGGLCEDEKAVVLQVINTAVTVEATPKITVLE